MALAAGTREEGWWEEDYRGAVPEWVGLHAGLEAACTTLHDYQCELIHGLLQTEDYARAVTRSNASLSDEVVEQRVAFRMGQATRRVQPFGARTRSLRHDGRGDGARRGFT